MPINVLRHPAHARILFAVPEGELYANEFGELAAALPEAESRFVGLSWCTGATLRARGMTYQHVRWSCEPVIRQNLPPVAEFMVAGHQRHDVSDAKKRAFGRLEAFLRAEVAKYNPGLVIYGPIDHAICYLLDEIAREAGIARLGIQPCHLANRFIVNHEGVDWERSLRTAGVQASRDPTVSSQSKSEVHEPRRINSARQKVWSLSLWLRGLEYCALAAQKERGFHTLGSIAERVVARVRPRPWFPELRQITAVDEESVLEDIVLVVLNQPALSWDRETWVALVEFALSASPGEAPLVIRVHPRETAREVSPALMRRLLARDVRISVAGKGPTLDQLLQRSTAVMTLTSAVGMDALLAGVTVISLGPAYYARPGLAHAATSNDADAIRSRLQDGGSLRPDSRAVVEFFAWFVEERTVSLPSLDVSSEYSLCSHVRSMLTRGK